MCCVCAVVFALSLASTSRMEPKWMTTAFNGSNPIQSNQTIQKALYDLTVSYILLTHWIFHYIHHFAQEFFVTPKAFYSCWFYYIVHRSSFLHLPVFSFSFENKEQRNEQKYTAKKKRIYRMVIMAWEKNSFVVETMTDITIAKR